MTTSMTSTGTALASLAIEPELVTPRALVRHDTPYVTQLIANAANLPNMPQRRRSDRAGPLAAYAPRSPRDGRTRLIA